MSNATYKSSEPPAKRRKMSSNSSSECLSSPSNTPIPTSDVVKLYLVQAKLTAQDISELFSLAEKHNLRVSKSLNAGPNHDSTKLQLCPSSEDADIIITNRHIDWNLAKEKAIVTPEWLRDSVQQRAILPCGDYAALRELKQNTVQNCPDSDDDTDGGGSCVSSLAQPDSEKLRYACLRPCPLVCPNQGLVNQFGIIRRSRELEGKDTKRTQLRTDNISYPHTLAASRLAEVSKLPGIGEKMLSKISEYVNYGKIRESQTIAASARFKSLSEFTTIYGIGAATARKLFDTFGLRTIADLEEHYARHEPPPQRFSDEEQARRIRHPCAAADLNEKIPRAEVDLMHDIVMGELGEASGRGIEEGKRRATTSTSFITHPTLTSGSDQVKGLGEALVNRSMNGHWDTLEKALTVFILPPDAGSPRRRIHRRLDLIFAAARGVLDRDNRMVTGSKMFERDLRLWAKVECSRFFCPPHSTRRRDSKRYFPRSEQEVFEILGLEWIDPTLRNADS
ncbi:hypothetical protein B0H14DRAFT_2989395 [Mycena olivaceomarginata]|nr:hypothetical protein B0H14DRAFT_2989395 [Mycena olivaceomarginata]